MTEEKSRPNGIPPEAGKEEKSQTPAQAAAEAAPPKTEAKMEPAAVKKERPANCAVCNKSIRKLRWYYRNGKYYCTQRCWKTTLKKKEEAPKTGPAEAK